MMLGRSTYTSAEEQDAEVMASLSLKRATRAATQVTGCCDPHRPRGPVLAASEPA